MGANTPRQQFGTSILAVYLSKIVRELPDELGHVLRRPRCSVVWQWGVGESGSEAGAGIVLKIGKKKVSFGYSGRLAS